MCICNNGIKVKRQTVGWQISCNLYNPQIIGIRLCIEIIYIKKSRAIKKVGNVLYT